MSDPLSELRRAVAGASVDANVGRTLGRWLLERPLGRGGFGAVYAARNVQTGAEAASARAPRTSRTRYGARGR